MSILISNNKRVILIFWKNQAERPFEIFSNLKNFCLSYPEYNYNTLNNYLSKRKIPFENMEVRVERKNIITRPKEKTTSAGNDRKIMPVVRKIAMKEANDSDRDWEYWLGQSSSRRLEALTFIITQSLAKGARLDKTVINKKTLGA
ncbi:hypothetical protein [Chitinophaga barathri]|uniref:Uncharacterized protein n=1 Tax=Chitinophaga barathri TaxID=1647451 RepID=A0A3N4MCV5_9BACT|nr:hypothetical protein [Chitinophaga barathri]RPD39746.1 hypothetical protein EG028_19095 [Chitinophaga barathri]